MSKLYNRLIELRKANLYTQSDIADRLQIGQKRYAAWEEGRAEPNIAMLIKIADLYNITIDELVMNRKINTIPKISDNSREQELIDRIVGNWGNVKIPFIEMIKWLKQYKNIK